MRALNRWIPLLLLLLTASAAVAAPETAANLYTVRYELHYLDLHAAEVVAWEQCPAAIKDRCQVTARSAQEGRPRSMDVFADSPTQERVARILAKVDTMPPTRVFQAVLLAASNRPGAVTPELAPGAQKALADIHGLLPFKSYEQLDGTLLRTTESAEGNLIGREGRKYKIILRFNSAGSPGSDDLFVNVFRFREEMSFPEAKAGDQRPRNQRDLISTSFGLKRGETIVVGTSKSDAGDEALVLLLTAAQ